MLKVLAIYRQDSDVQIIADAAHKPLLPNNFIWSVILDQFTVDHPCSIQMVDSLRQPIPAGFISVAYLDMANALCLASRLETHPFANVNGVERLIARLKESDERFFSIFSIIWGRNGNRPRCTQVKVLGRFVHQIG